MNYLNFCVLVAPYLVATLGVLGLIALIGFFLLLIVAVWQIAVERLLSRIKSDWFSTKTWQDFKLYRKEKSRLE